MTGVPYATAAFWGASENLTFFWTNTYYCCNPFFWKHPTKPFCTVERNVIFFVEFFVWILLALSFPRISVVQLVNMYVGLEIIDGILLFCNTLFTITIWKTEILFYCFSLELTEKDFWKWHLSCRHGSNYDSKFLRDPNQRSSARWHKGGPL